MEVAGYTILTFEFKRLGPRWLARCRELGTAGCGDTLQHAKEVIADLATLHVNILEEAGERKAFFREHGIRFYKQHPRKRALPRFVPVADNTYVQCVTVPVRHCNKEQPSPDA